MTNKAKYWWCQIIGWTLFIVEYIITYLMFARKIVWVNYVDIIWQALIGFIISALMHRLIVGQKILQRDNAVQLMHLVPLVIVFGAIWSAFYNVPGLFGMMVPSGKWSFSYYFRMVIGRSLYFFEVYLVWALLYFSYHYVERLKKQQSELLEQESAKNLLIIEKLESEKRSAELQQKATDMEMQALRAQMNPHFIFNSLSSINHFVLKNETEIASDYLTKFSRLIRMVLNNSQKKLISLEEDMNMLQLYIELEKLRFKNSFDCKINYSDNMDVDSIFIAPMLLQPFVENAIWHGLMNKEQGGHIDIVLSTDKGFLSCCIIDNGIGRRKAGELKPKLKEHQKSMGLQITKQRLALLNEEFNDHAFYSVDDLVNENGEAAGTKVILKIRFQTHPDLGYDT